MRIWLLTLLLSSTWIFAQEDEFFEASTTVGGYGELHYNNVLQNSQTKETLDFHRFVIFVEHNWTPWWSFKSELELEHNFLESGASGGEIALEQAYIEYRHAPWLSLRAGVLLLNVGLTNPYHEPPLFFSVERPEYSSYIIPTTWYGNGFAVVGRQQAFEYNFTVMEGLDGAGFSVDKGIRGGRQKGYKADTSHLLYSLNLDYTGWAGWRIGTSLTYNKAPVNPTQHLPFQLLEGHLDFKKNNWLIRAEAGQIIYDAAASGFLVKRALGYYLDIGYDVAPLIGWRGAFIPWVRLTTRDTANDMLNGTEDGAHRYTKWLAGVQYKPLEQVVIKAEAGRRERASDGMTTDLFNLGMGYMF
ncbi:MAG: hypothetical protein D6677_09530 [Calditrichaeota bacterium]|nr:MAG: hypothetical protein D6677_09530 [Calditrichota bacterium]